MNPQAPAPASEPLPKPAQPPATRPASFWAIGWRALRRDARAGELHLLLLAVALAVSALTAVGFFADRLQQGLQRDARHLLGGDAVVRSDQPLPAAFVQQAQALGLELTQHLGFPTMARADDAQGGAARLVALKAVQDNYPLRGQLLVGLAPGDAGQATTEVPRPGTVWVDPALLAGLGVQVGQALWLGDSRLTIERLIVLEPDRGGGFMSLQPRVLLHQSDLTATGLLQPASRVSYRLVLAGPDAAVQQYTAWAQTELERSGVRGAQLESFEAGRPELQQTLERAEQFLGLVALLAALLCAVAVSIAARVYATRHLDSCAMLRVLGLSQATMARAYALSFVLVGLLAGVIGVLLGYLLHHGFVLLLAELLRAELPPPSAWPALFGLGVGLTLMLAFGLPPVLQLAQVPPLRVIRREVGGIKPASLGVLLLGGLGFAALLLAVSPDLRLGLIALGGVALAAALFAAASFGAVRLLRRWVNEATAPTWLRLATRQIAARPAYAVLQISALAIGLMALLLLVLLRTDLISSWQQATPPDAPNRFAINIQPDQAEAFQASLRAQGLERFDWYPMFRGRLVAINDQPIDLAALPTDRGRRLAEREFNLSHSAQPPSHNAIVAGRWQPEEPGSISVEDGLAEDLGLQLGDRLTFEIAGVPVQARISSLREVDWSSMRANFFVLFPVSQLPEVPVTYLSAFRAPVAAGFDAELVRDYPNITLIDLSATLAQLQQVLAQVSRAVEFLFAFALAAGLVVLFAAIGATRAEREREYAILRALGAQTALLRRVQRAELAGIGLLAGLLAALAALAINWALARWVFGFDWTPALWTPAAGALAGAALALAAGWAGLRAVLRTPVVQTLRAAAQ
ncbi:predicted ABC-type transport system involved in lysophospholipase L1 biosynthesis, permease component [Serpentinimonas maccroryi]|uniref:Predicted ABC-type transport system involved in lysophospholipase L1 biosynthesis, permease component n=1 Tax=Serpentinimonas maccroryi TaxID=1458426 RepID=A0A060NPI3_9BURK|nr:FtsX-like permease family protein [Serpentinimonas maccroryi]BAO83275.1 predicted ABC-type transport system involved in lysophospholipase L1 biosynthesis, permease component [Serpentinimonas maccroryi]